MAPLTNHIQKKQTKRNAEASNTPCTQSTLWQPPATAWAASSASPASPSRTVFRTAKTFWLGIRSWGTCIRCMILGRFWMSRRRPLFSCFLWVLSPFLFCFFCGFCGGGGGLLLLDFYHSSPSFHFLIIYPSSTSIFTHKSTNKHNKTKLTPTPNRQQTKTPRMPSSTRSPRSVISRL